MIYSVTKNYIPYSGENYTRLNCVIHTFTYEEALYQEDMLNGNDHEPSIYYETLVSDTVDKCDFCNLEVVMLIYSD